jgi:CRP/FNR family cyclic AMP-dependent transcriptional regulator
VTKQIVKKLKKTTKNASNLAFLDVTGRLANTLIDLSSQADAISSPQGMQIKITRQELAKIIVCSREMVGRVLKQLQDEGLVIVNGKTITILRPK